MSKLMSSESIKNEVTRFARHYATARSRSTHPAFASYATANALLEAVHPDSPLEYCDRDALIVAIVTEAQNAPHPLWQALLLGAFERLLVRLRLQMSKRPDEDIDQDLLLTFLEAIRQVRVGSYTVLAIRWAIEGALRDQRQKARHAPQFVVYDDDLYMPDPFGAGAEAKASAQEIVRILEASEGKELLDAILATTSADESLHEYVDRTYAGVSAAARAAAYDRLKVSRQRVVLELRERLASSSRVA